MLHHSLLINARFLPKSVKHKILNSNENTEVWQTRAKEKNRQWWGRVMHNLIFYLRKKYTRMTKINKIPKICYTINYHSSSNKWYKKSWKDGPKIIWNAQKIHQVKIWAYTYKRQLLNAYPLPLKNSPQMLFFWLPRPPPHKS